MNYNICNLKMKTYNEVIKKLHNLRGTTSKCEEIRSGPSSLDSIFRFLPLKQSRLNYLFFPPLLPLPPIDACKLNSTVG